MILISRYLIKNAEYRTGIWCLIGDRPHKQVLQNVSVRKRKQSRLAKYHGNHARKVGAT